MLLIPLISNPAVSNAAESTPVTVSIGPVNFTNLLAQYSIITVSHSDGVVSTTYVRVLSSGEDELDGYEISSAKASTVTITAKPGKFVELAGEPGVLLGLTSAQRADTKLLDTGYNPSTTCTSSDYGVCLTVALKDKPQTGTQVVQMPTTGAPEGLTTTGIAALGIGVAGLLAAAVRRRA